MRRRASRKIWKKRKLELLVSASVISLAMMLSEGTIRGYDYIKSKNIFYKVNDVALYAYDWLDKHYFEAKLK